MPVALTRCMSLKIVARKLAALVAATLALCSVACAGGDEARTYTGTDVEAGLVTESVAATTCQAGAVQSCTIWLGQHGDLSNCIHGVNVCSDGAWSKCLDEDTVANNPDLYASLAGDK
jgi:hypothetical protein